MNDKKFKQIFDRFNESLDVDDTWMADSYSQEEFDEIYLEAKEIMTQAMDKICEIARMTVSSKEEENMVDAILEEVVFSPRTDFFD